MRWPAVLALVLAAACEPAAGPLREVSVQGPQAARLSLRELPTGELAALRLSYGLVVVEAGALARLAGLRVGDVVHGVERQRIGKLEDFSRLVAARAGEQLVLRVRRGGADLDVSIDFSGGRGPRGTLLRT